MQPFMTNNESDSLWVIGKGNRYYFNI